MEIVGVSPLKILFCAVEYSRLTADSVDCAMARLWVGGLEVGISERDLEDEVRSCGRCTPADLQQHASCAAVYKIRQTEECLGSTKGMRGSKLENRLDKT